MYFINPTAGPDGKPGGRIQPHLETWDKTSIRVTRTCGPCGHAGNPHGHSAAEGCALDLGDGRCTRPVLAAADGVVMARDASQVLQGIVRIQHAGGWRTDYAHMHPVLVKGGQAVKQGQQIGEIGDAHDPAVTQFSGCHLHYVVLFNGVQQNPAAYINMPPPQGDDVDKSFEPIVNRTTTVNAGARHRTAPSLDSSTIAIASDPGGALKFPLAGKVKGAVANGSDVWYVYWRPEVDKWYYLHSTVCGPLTPVEVVQTPAPPQDCSDEIKAATDPLQQQITDLTAISVAQAQKISDAKAALG